MNVNKSLYPLPQSFSSITSMQRDMDKLSLQLASGKRHTTLADFGKDRLHDLNLRARLGRIEGFEANITTMENRLSFLNNSIERLDELEAEARDLAVPSAYGSDGVNMVNASKRAEVMLREVVDLLNTDIAGKHIFGGHVSETDPVSAYDTIMQGTPGKAGFERVASDRRFADLGIEGRGRLSAAEVTGTVVTLAEDGAHDFGLKLQTASGGGGFAMVAEPAGDPASLTVSLSGVPKPGDSVTIGLGYPDGRTEYVTLTATTETDPGPGQFTIGADAAQSAQNFAQGLDRQIETLAGSTLASASTLRAADDFFVSGGNAPQRVVLAAPPADPYSVDPVLLEPDTDYENTVHWYNGQASEDARGTVSAQIDETTRVRVGVTADESGFTDLIKSLAAFATSDFNSTQGETEAEKAATRARFDAMADGARVRLSEDNNTTQGSIESIALDLGLASNTLANVKERHTSYGAQLTSLLADIETAPIEEVAMRMLDLQTRLQASFQATTMVNQLTLVNYLR